MISVLLPVFNSEKYLKEAIQSILNQTFENFELIIINDRSTDNSLRIIKSYLDPRIKLISNRKNMGVAKSLNRGLNMAKGKYIIRMDADDVCLKGRFKKQVKFLENNPKIGICGTWVHVFGTTNYLWQSPVDHKMIRARMLFESSIAHPSVIMRRSFLQKNKIVYEEKYVHAQDFALWVRAGEKIQLHNYPEPLLRYRTHQGQTPVRHRLSQQRSSWKIRKYQLKKLAIKPNKQDQKIHQSLSNWSTELKPRDFWSIGRWLKLLLTQNYKKKYYSQPHLALVIGERWAGTLALHYKQNILILLFVILYPSLSLLSLYYLVVRFLKIKK